MLQRTLVLASMAVVTGCYFSPEKHRAADDFAVDEAGVAPSNNGSSMDAALDAIVTTSDAGDAASDAGCSADDQCPSATPQCKRGVCLACDETQDCARFPATPVCAASGACVACSAESKQLCTGMTPACDPVVNACVQCVADSDCPSDTQAACQSDHTCAKCSEDADCARFGKVCNARSGACVQCRPESEEADCRNEKSCDPKTADCAGRACDPKQFTCTERQRGSVATCSSCVSDSECVADHRCIAMTFGAAGKKQELGSFCLKRSSTGCTTPYTTTISRASANGVAAENYCGIRESDVSCPAVRLFGTATECDGTDSSCGVPGARCATVANVPNRCTYSCVTNYDCYLYANFVCGGPSNALYCGAAM